MAKKRPKAPDANGMLDKRRRELLDSAFTLIAERGLEGLRTRDIAARANVNISTLHYYFGTKDKLIAALVDYANSKFREPRRSNAGETLDVLGDLHDHLVGAWRAFHATPHLATVLQELVVRSKRDTKTRSAFRALHTQWNAIVAGVIGAGVADGRLRADLDPTIAARVVTSFIMGAVVQLEVNPQAFEFERAAAALEQWLAAPRSRRLLKRSRARALGSGRLRRSSRRVVRKFQWSKGGSNP
jgi:AcrR family transcriptional regulator